MFAYKTAVMTLDEARITAEVMKALTEDFIETLDKMGINDKTAQGIIIQSIAKESNIGALVTAAQNGNMDDFTGTSCEIIADSVLRCIGRGELSDYLPDGLLGSAVSGAVAGAENVYNGQYGEAYKAFLYSAMEYYPYMKAAKAVIATAEAGNSMCIDYAVECGYEEYMNHNGDEAMWGAIFNGAMRAGLDRMKIAYRKSYAAVNGMTLAQIEADEDLKNRLDSAVEEGIKRRFRNRAADAEKAAAEKKLVEKQIERFAYYGLLEYDCLRDLDAGMTMTERLNSLYKIRQSIIDIAGGDITVFGENETLQNDALAYAITEWMRCGTANRGDFYKWMEQQGYIKRPTKPAAEYAWVLDE